jgi:hypothetical protein
MNAGSFEKDAVSIPLVLDAEFPGQITGKILSGLSGLLVSERMVSVNIYD